MRGELEIFQKPKVAQRMRSLLLGSAVILSVPSTLLALFGAPSLLRALESLDYLRAFGISASFAVVALAYSSLLLFGFGAQQVRVSPVGFSPQFRPWRRIRTPCFVQWSEVVRVEISEANLILPAKSLIVRGRGRKVYVIPTRSFPDEELLIRFVNQNVPVSPTRTRFGRPKSGIT